MTTFVPPDIHNNGLVPEMVLHRGPRPSLSPRSLKKVYSLTTCVLVLDTLNLATTCDSFKRKTYVISVLFPVKGPNFISWNGGENPRIKRASSCVIGARLKNTIVTIIVTNTSLEN